MNYYRLLKKYLLILVLPILILFNIFVSFSQNNVSEINMLVSINDDGSANITQEWVGTFNDGTENFIPLTDMDYNVSNFIVSMDGKGFVTEANWDIEASFNEKSYKCGINEIDDGIELCFGISEYGSNKYVISYDIDKLVYSYEDLDGFNFKFINDNMSTFPTNINIVLRLTNNKQLTDSNARIWAFGYDGNIEFNDGYVHAYSRSELNYNNYAVIMMSFDKGVLNPNYKRSGSFDETKNRAFEGSDYGEEIYGKIDSILERIANFFIYGVFGLVIIIIISNMISSTKNKISIKRFYKEVNYFRDVPNAGDIAMSFSLSKDFHAYKMEDGNIITALILKMINDGVLEPSTDTTVGLFGIEKKMQNLIIKKEPTNIYCKKLFDIIKVCAGGDNTLDQKELERIGKSYDTSQKIVSFVDSIYTDGRSNLNKIKSYKKVLSKYLNDLTDIGKEQLAEVFGLRKYLDEFTLISEREDIEVSIWDDYLVYGALFGIAEKVLSQYKKAYPGNIDQIRKYDNNVTLSNYYNTLVFYRASQLIRAREMQRMRTMGSGGSASFGGGGGFSGGGSGGGSR